jgi:hypothetical protein
MSKVSPGTLSQQANRQDARFQEQLHDIWRDWRAFLQSTLTINELEHADPLGAPAFERDSSGSVERNEAQARLDAIAPEWKHVFQAYYESYRVLVQDRMEREHARGTGGEVLDPADVTRTAIQELLDRAEGKVHLEDAPPGYGEVPINDEERYVIHAQSLLAAPSESVWEEEDESDQTKKRLMIGIPVILVLLLVAFFLLPGGDDATSGEGDIASVEADGQDLSLWPMQSLTVVGNGGSQVSLAIDAVDVLPGPDDGPVGSDVALWDRSQYWPMETCVAPDVLADVQSIRVSSGNRQPDRVYRLTSVAEEADLIVRSCHEEEEGDTPDPHYGVLQGTAPLDIASPGDTRSLTTQTGNEVRVTLERIDLIGNGQDPTIPPGRIRILVTAQMEPVDALPWQDLQPQIILENGDIANPSGPPAPHGEGSDRLTYVFDRPDREIPLQWLVSGDSGVQRWQTTIGPAPSRAVVLYDLVRVRNLDVSHGENPGTLIMSVDVANNSETPLMLQPSDFLVEQNGQVSVSFDEDTQERNIEPIEGDGNRVFRLLLRGIREGEPITFLIGGDRYEITP